MIPYVRIEWKQSQYSDRMFTARFDDVVRAATYIDALKCCGFWVERVVVVENG